MDIRYYFDAIEHPVFEGDNPKMNKNSLGYLIAKNMSGFSGEELDSYEIAIIGVPFDERTPNKGTAKAPDEIRKYLYPLDNFDQKLKIIDLGNLKKGQGAKDIYYALRDVVDYLLNQT